MSAYGWDTFWKNERDAFSEVMKIGTTYFCERLTELLGVKKGAEIFDYGCGPGFIADFFKSREVSITGADINDFFIRQCRSKHAHSLFIKIESNPEANRGIFDRNLEGKKFDFVIFLSISQYLKNLEDLEGILTSVLPYTKISGKIILADVIDPESSNFKDAFSLFRRCVSSGKIDAYFAFMFYLLSSRYGVLSQNVKLLKISRQSLSTIADKNDLNLQHVKNLTIHSTRSNYILTKK
jgi:2-polyprenyl-3-methyl-5-hydroxy-6-metoxy-1,4-benzoquinol methylase